MKVSVLKWILLLLVSVLISEKTYSSVDACIKVASDVGTAYPYPVSNKTVYICPYYSLNLIGYNCLGNTTPAQEQYYWVNLSDTTFSQTSSAQNFFTSDTGRWELTLTNTSDMSVDKDTIYVKFFNTPGFTINGFAKVVGACTYQNISMVVNTPAGTSNYQWYMEGNSTALATGTAYTIPSTSVPGGSWNYIATSDYNGVYGGGAFSCVLVDSIIAFTEQTPIVTLPKDTSVCAGQTLKIKASVWLEPDNVAANNSTISFQWNGAGAFTNGNDSVTTSSSVGTHTYWVNGKNLLGCHTGDTITVVVNSNLTVKLGTMATICAGDSVILADTVSGASGPYTFTWTPSTGLNNNTVQSPIAKPAANSTTIYSVNVTDDITGCKGSASRTVKVLAPVAITPQFPDSTTCGTDSVQLKVLITGGSGSGYSFAWSPNTSISSTTAQNPYVFPGVATSYSVSVTDGLNCKGTSSSVSIDKLSVKLPNDTSSFKGDSIKLNAFNSTQPGFSYKWFDSTGAIVGTGSYLYVNTTNRYIVEVYNPVTNCFVSDTINVAFTKDLIPAVWVPNVFNPTLADSNNSTLRVYGNGIIDSNFVFQVFDNWGQIVYETYTFTDANTTGWNGTLKNSGQELNTGVYTFTLRGEYLDGSKFSKTGTASLLK